MTDDLKPRLGSVKEAARLLDLTPASVYKLLDAREIDSVYIGRLRKVVIASLDDYIDRLPTTAPVDDEDAA